ncbi:MAG: hypothetical protein GY861_00980 [bacterium]|nr:hypothetical protein [bacterium]
MNSIKREECEGIIKCQKVILMVSLTILMILCLSLTSCSGKRIEYLPSNKKIIDTDKDIDFDFEACDCAFVKKILAGKYCFDKGYWDDQVADKLEKCKAVLKARKEKDE